VTKNLLLPRVRSTQNLPIKYNAKGQKWQGQQLKRPFLWIRSPKPRFFKITGREPELSPNFPQKTRTKIVNTSTLQPQIERVLVASFNIEMFSIWMQWVQ
jgi:hypothetical protein